MSLVFSAMSEIIIIIIRQIARFWRAKGCAVDRATEITRARARACEVNENVCANIRHSRRPRENVALACASQPMNTHTRAKRNFLCDVVMHSEMLTVGGGGGRRCFGVRCCAPRCCCSLLLVWGSMLAQHFCGECVCVYV